MTAVLVVDDSLTVRMDLHDAFAAAGFDPVACAGAAEARSALAARRFGLVVLDVLLPDGDGLELLAEIKRSPAHAGTPVVLLSTAAEVQARIRGREVGADDYVGKPYDAAALVARAHDLVRAAARGGDGAASPRGPILVVDDSVTVREELRAELQQAGLEVATAADGEEGLRVAADRRPAAVVVDGAMPGMDGATFIRQLRSDAVLRTTPCILLTASRSVGELRALDAGADAYVRKEEGHDVVLARLQALLRSSSPPSQVGAAAMLAPKRMVALAFARERTRALAERVRLAGHEPVEASSVDEALALLAVDVVDALVVEASSALDAALDACARLKALPSARRIPLVVVGGGDDQRVVLRALHAGADDCVVAESGAGVLRARLAAQLRRKQFEDENRHREAFARSAAILETISDAFFAVDREWGLVYLNHAFEALVGGPGRLAPGDSLWRVPALAGGDAEQALRRAAAQGAPLTFEVAFPHERWFELRAFPHGDGLSAHLRDVTERRRSQEVQAHLLGIVGHDLRTPLTSIMVSASALVRDRAVADRHKRALERVEAGAARMSRLINDLLDYSRARLGQGLPVQPTPADLDAICLEALDAIRAAQPARNVVYRHEGDGHGAWDPERVTQALLNLLTNAMRYSAPETDVTLSWRGHPDRKVIAVHNHGPPIEPSLLGQLFEPFKRGDEAGNTWGGVGLGLYIVRQIVVAHGGAVAVRSAEGEGTTFELELPTTAVVRPAV
jgi:DNA-binding response OmpR family regulator